MDVQEYERFRGQLAEAGFRESGARCDESAFGSWFVVMAAIRDSAFFGMEERITDHSGRSHSRKMGGSLGHIKQGHQTAEALIQALAAL